MNKRTAGEYRCQVGNIIDLLDNEDENINSSVPFSFQDLNKAKSTKVRLSYLPNEKANVAFFTLVLTCFIAAFVINLVRRSSKPLFNYSEGEYLPISLRLEEKNQELAPRSKSLRDSRIDQDFYGLCLLRKI